MNSHPDFEKKELALSSTPYVYLPVNFPAFVVEVSHREDIDGDLLQQALERTLQRMPYLKDTLVEENGAIWYAKNPLPMEAAHTSRLRRVGGSETNYHMLDLTWDGNKTWFSMFHGFCDGKGIDTFLESVLYHYYCLKDKKEYAPNGIRTSESEMTEAEYLDPLSHAYEVPADYTMPEKKEQPVPYHIPECSPTDNPEIKAYGLRLDSDELMGFVRENKTSPSVALSMLVGEAILHIHPEADAPIFVNIPISLRRMLGCEETFKNCSSRVVLPISGTPMDALPFAERASALRGMLKQQMDPNRQKSVYNRLRLMYSKRMTEAVSYEEEIKKPAGFYQTSHDTFYIDYIGSLRSVSYLDQIADVRFLCPPTGGSTMHINVIECNGRFSLEALSRSDLSVYAEAIRETAKDHGLNIQTEAEKHFTLPLTAWREGSVK
ncbi:MAG: hypothetical protein J6O55_02555 [Lachnospiraceae bacterium]|nr:hypothetical protein [Lachnospiraceae bacterium]